MNFSLREMISGTSRDGKQMACALRECPNTLLMRIVAQGNTGIRVDQDWYCSAGCFAEAAFNRFNAISAGRVVEMPHSPRLTIGLAMLAKGYLTEGQLRYATAHTRIRGEALEVVLIRLGLADEWQLTAARAAQWGVPVLGKDRIGHPVEADIPVALLRAYSAAPLHYSAAGKRLILGFVYRVEHSLLISLEEITGCRAEPCFITPTEYAEQMTRLTAIPDHREMVFENSLTPAQMANSLAGAAVEVSAREARFAHSRNLVWVRLAGKRRKIDVLFRGKIESGIEITGNSLPVEDRIGSWG
jgi:Type II secretion system (T2SS), protein E, N-terminal domain